MISRIKIFVMLGALVLAPTVARAQLLGTSGGGGSDDPVSFCCQTTSSMSGQGCFAVPTGAAGIALCPNNYLDCGRGAFTCTTALPAKAAVMAGGGSSNLLKSCSCNTPLLSLGR